MAERSPSPVVRKRKRDDLWPQADIETPQAENTLLQAQNTALRRQIRETRALKDMLEYMVAGLTRKMARHV